MAGSGTNRPVNAADIHAGWQAKSEAAGDSCVLFRGYCLCGFPQIIVRMAHMAWHDPSGGLPSASGVSMAGVLESCVGWLGVDRASATDVYRFRMMDLFALSGAESNMTINEITNVLVTITLMEMMITIGLGVNISDLMSVARDWKLLAKALFANYICVPAATIGLLLLFGAQPLVAVGFLITAFCPGAPYGPPLTAIARGNMTVAVGLMVLLAGSSAILAPVLLGLFLPLMAGDEPLHVDTVRIVRTLLFTQLLPLSVGLTLHHYRPALAERLMKPGNVVGKLLNLLACGLIIGTQYPMLFEVRLRGYFGMLLLVLVSFAAGWICGGPGDQNRRTLALTTSLRNVGVGLVIATGNFAGTPAVTAVLAYGLFEVFASLLLALWWGRRSRPCAP